MTHDTFAYHPPDYQPLTSAVMSDPIDWWAELRTAALVTVFAALLGAAVGPIWHALAPQVHIIAAAQGSSSADKALLGDDLWLGLLGVLAGAICVLATIVVAPKSSSGPGAQLGLVIGGALGMLVAAHVGHRIGHQDLANVVRTNYPQGGQHAVDVLLSYFDFKVRLSAVLLTWPVASLVLNTNNVWVKAVKQPTRAPSASYPGSS